MFLHWACWFPRFFIWVESWGNRFNFRIGWVSFKVFEFFMWVLQFFFMIICATLTIKSLLTFFVFLFRLQVAFSSLISFFQVQWVWTFWYWVIIRFRFSFWEGHCTFSFVSERSRSWFFSGFFFSFKVWWRLGQQFCKVLRFCLWGLRLQFHITWVNEDLPDFTVGLGLCFGLFLLDCFLIFLKLLLWSLFLFFQTVLNFLHLFF